MSFKDRSAIGYRYRVSQNLFDDVEKDLRMLRISGWRGKARRRDEWKSVLREVKVLQGP
jgi:hypothetical protein